MISIVVLNDADTGKKSKGFDKPDFCEVVSIDHSKGRSCDQGWISRSKCKLKEPQIPYDYN